MTTQYDDQFEIVIELDVDLIHSTVRTGCLSLAKRRAETLILKDKIRLV